MSDDDDFSVLVSLSSKEVNFLLAESYKLENINNMPSFETINFQRALQKYSLDQLRTPLIGDFSRFLNVEESKWLCLLLEQTASLDFVALHSYLLNALVFPAENFEHQQLIPPAASDR